MGNLKNVFKKIINFIVNYAGFKINRIELPQPIYLKKTTIDKKGDVTTYFKWNDIIKIASNQNKSDFLEILRMVSENSVLSWEQLRDFSSVVPYTQDHLLYEQTLNNYDDKLELNLSRKSQRVEFLGQGHGPGTLNAYRKLEFDGSSVFEKIYQNNSRSLKSIEWFFEHVKDRLDPKVILVPEVLHILRGDRLTAIYFEYINIKQLKKNLVCDRILDVSMSLHNIKLPKYDNFPIELYDFSKNYMYRGCYKRAEKLLKEISIQNLYSLHELEDKTKEYSLRICHGDLDGIHLGDPLYVIDWDNCGVFPLGFDIARGLSASFSCNRIKIYENYLFTKCYPKTGNMEWSEFLYSCLYFSFIFYAGRSLEDGNNLWIDIYKRVIELFEY
jgi:hypothetical protein